MTSVARPLSEMEARDVPRLSIPPVFPLDISTHISLFHARCGAICHLVSRFYNFLGERFREFRELPGNLERLETLQRMDIYGRGICIYEGTDRFLIS